MDLNGELATALAGRYEIERELGRGGMAVVYLARDVKHGRRVAVKVLLPELASAMGAERFLREIAIAAPLVHPNILAVHDSGEAAGFLYYVTPYVDGGTLRQRLDRETQLAIGDALAVAKQIAAALDHAHAHGMVHRDVKPENVLLLHDHVLVADFGLARALSSVASTPLTAGVVVGTPAYMSPEQCTPGRPVDGRTDIYALACVVFEMIAGETPFRGRTSSAMIAHHLSTPAPSLCAERESCPAALDAAVHRALSKVPADRFATAGAFVDAASGAGAVVNGTGAAPARRRAAMRWLTPAAAGALGVLAWLGVRGSRVLPLARAPAPDTMRVALLPLEGGAKDAADTQEELIYEAFARWKGIALVDPFQVSDAVRQRGPVQSDDDARAVARTLGAGRYVRGRIVRVGDSSRVRVGLYDVGSREPLQVASVHLALTGAGATQAYQHLADSLLLRVVPGDYTPAPGESHSLDAVRAFTVGQRALDEWDLLRADSALDAARRADPEFGRAQLWLAQVRAWQRLPADMWRDPAQRAAKARKELGEHDAALARALVLLGSGQFAGACRVYDSLRVQNGRDFTAWYGLGQCRTLDRVVVRDATSPSGWRFRSSWGAGLAAYTRALMLLPSAHRSFQTDAFASLRYLLLTDRDALVGGYSVGADSDRFWGRLGAVGDSIVVVPYPWRQIAGGTPLYPPGFERAIAHQRANFGEIARTWATALPSAAAAKEALSLALEMTGDPSAAETLRVARQLTLDREKQIQLGVAEVLTRVKFAMSRDLGQLRLARVLGDSLLSAASASSPLMARRLEPVAELLGHCELAVNLASRAAVASMMPVPISVSYEAESAELRIRHAMGCASRTSTLSVGVLAQRLERDPVYGQPQARQLAKELLLVSAAQLSFPDDRAGIAVLANARGGAVLDAMQQTLAGDTAKARRTIANIQSQRSSPPHIEVALAEARLSLVLNDTIGALGGLRASLGAIAGNAPWSLTVPARAACLVRALALRSELEAERGAHAQSRALAAAVITLWSGGDLQALPVVRRMRALANASNDVTSSVSPTPQPGEKL